MDNIYLLVEHGRDQGEVYVLGWFEDERRARQAAEAMEWEAYRAELKSKTSWTGETPVAPDKASHRRFWVKGVTKFMNTTVPATVSVH
jgi:hypothetical protein